MLRVTVQLSTKPIKIKTRNDIEDFLAFSIKSLEGFAILFRGATKTVSGFMSIQHVADQHEDTTIETTDVGFTFAGGETEAASTNICIPDAEFAQGISVNVVSNESTLFLIGLDVSFEYGLVIDYHYNRVYSHILKRYFLCAILPTGHLALEMMPSSSEKGQRPVWGQAFSRLAAGASIQGHMRKEHFHLNRPYFISMKRKSEHEHKHTSTSEDDLSNSSGMPEDTQTWSRFDKRAKTYRTTSSSGPGWENVVARITIDDKTGHFMSL